MANPTSILVCSLFPRKKCIKVIDFLEQQKNVSVTYLSIQGKEVVAHRFRDYDCVILIHSIEIGRMSLTDVKDARYNDLLPRIKSSLGRDRIAVLITGVKRSENLETLKQRALKEQKTLMDCSAYVTVCHSLEENRFEVITQMLSRLSSSSKHMEIQSATIAESTPTRQGGTVKSQVSNLTLTAVPMPGQSLGSIDGSNGIDLIICADGSTTDTLLKTLEEESVMNMMNFKVYKQVSDQWNYVCTRTSSDDPPDLYCAVFIYWTTAPTEITEDDHEMFQRIMKETNCIQLHTTQEVLRGETDVDFLMQLIKCIAAPSPGLTIVTATPRKPSKGSASLADQRNADYYMEVKLTDKARQRIQTIEDEAEEIRDQIRALEMTKRQLDSTVKSLESSSSSLKRDVANKKQELNDTEQQYAKMEREMAASSSSLKRDVANKKQELNDIEEQYAKIEREMAASSSSLKLDVANKKQELNDIEEQYATMERKMTASSSSLKRDVANKKKDLKDIEEQCLKMQIKMTYLSNKVKTKEKESEPSLSGRSKTKKDTKNPAKMYDNLDKLVNDHAKANMALHNIAVILATIGIERV